eukprot:SAG11_NODE_961_length_6379_cov_141.081529_2_plen_111_part_00
MKSRSIPTCSKVPALVLYLPNKAYLDLFTQIVDQNVNLTVLLVTTRILVPVPASFYGPDSFGKSPNENWYQTGTQAPSCFRQLTAWQISENWPKTRSKMSRAKIPVYVHI